MAGASEPTSTATKGESDPLRQAIFKLREGVEAKIIGQRDVIELLVLALLSDGHALLEGLPGLAKTRAVKTMAQVLGTDLHRVQFTPDLLPSDVTGSVVYHAEQGSGRFQFEKGPIFGNVVLIDAINRAPAKVQSALLEAMEERQVTVAGESHPLPHPFFVLATQNPIEQEGTYPLPEAQLDRFLLHIRVGYPDAEAELAIVRMVRAEESGDKATTSVPLEAIVAARRAVSQSVKIAENVERYLVAIVTATRNAGALDAELGKQIEVGVSPRASLALDR
ncbi:MAG TPA: AAA family ATPase, partial [Polyangiaceae bacterium]